MATMPPSAPGVRTAITGATLRFTAATNMVRIFDAGTGLRLQEG